MVPSRELTPPCDDSQSIRMDLHFKSLLKVASTDILVGHDLMFHAVRDSQHSILFRRDKGAAMIVIKYICLEPRRNPADTPEKPVAVC